MRSRYDYSRGNRRSGNRHNCGSGYEDDSWYLSRRRLHLVAVLDYGHRTDVNLRGLCRARVGVSHHETAAQKQDGLHRCWNEKNTCVIGRPQGDGARYTHAINECCILENRCETRWSKLGVINQRLQGGCQKREKSSILFFVPEARSQRISCAGQ